MTGKRGVDRALHGGCAEAMIGAIEAGLLM
jgi:hypothetical protein